MRVLWALFTVKTSTLFLLFFFFFCLSCFLFLSSESTEQSKQQIDRDKPTRPLPSCILLLAKQSLAIFKTLRIRHVCGSCCQLGALHMAPCMYFPGVLVDFTNLQPRGESEKQCNRNFINFCRSARFRQVQNALYL